jgi:hypothetical protein
MPQSLVSPDGNNLAYRFLVIEDEPVSDADPSHKKCGRTRYQIYLAADYVWDQE